MATLAEDTFLDTDATTLASHTPTGTVPGTGYSDYGTLGDSRFIINNNRVNHNSAGGNDAGCLLDKATAYPSDYQVSADLVFLTDIMGFVRVIARASSSDFACYVFGWEGGEWRLARSSAGAALTTLGSTVAFAFPAADTVKKIGLRVVGDQISGYVDDVLTIGPITDATISAAGQPGMFSNANPAQTGTTGIVIDNLVVDDLASGGISFYLNNPVQGGSSAGLLDVSAPTASTSTTGWTVGTTVATRYSRATYNTEVGSANFTTTAQPSGAPSANAQDCYRLSAITSGTFSAGTWYSSVSVLAISSGGNQDGRARFRLWRSANADGSSPTEITQGTMIGSRTTNLSTTIAQTSSASTQISAVTLTNEYLLMQIAWETL